MKAKCQPVLLGLFLLFGLRGLGGFGRLFSFGRVRFLLNGGFNFFRLFAFGAAFHLAALFSPGLSAFLGSRLGGCAGGGGFRRGRGRRCQTFDAHLERALDLGVQIQFDFVFAGRAERVFEMDLPFVERDVELVLQLVGNHARRHRAEHLAVLARAFKNHNPKLDGDTLTELTQRTLDRLVFLRFLEDKHIELQNRIAYFGDKGTAWQDFIAESRRLDGIYNGIVYKKHEILDAPGFKLDDEAFSGVCERLSHLNSPYDFNAIPIHILGSIHERFLGKVIVTTDKRARLEEKPEVRKAGGVYYTPEYIVRCIVENTVGKLIAGKSPGQIGAARMADQVSLTIRLWHST